MTELTEKIKRRWQYLLAGGTGSKRRTDEIDKRVRELINRDVFKALRQETVTKSAQMTQQYKMLYDLTLAYRTEGSRYYGDEDIKRNICSSLEWLYANRYGESEKSGRGSISPWEYNWWDWQIGTPRLLIDILILLNCLPLSTIKRYLSLFHFLVPEPAMTGSNFLNICTELIGAAVLENDAETLTETAVRAGGIFVCCDGQTKKEGYYSDGSYLFHAHHAMNAAYGLEQLWSAAFLIRLMHDTSAAFSAECENAAVSWLLNGQMPFFFKGNTMRCVMGRYPNGGKIGRERLLCAAADLFDICSDTEKKKITALIKQLTAVQNDYETGLCASRCKIINKAVSEKSRYDDKCDRVFSGIDRIVHKRSGWAFAAAMNSERISGYECINGLDRYGWYHGDGMTQIMLSYDTEQFLNGYWDKVNPYRIPGVTADTQKRLPESVALEFDYLSDEDFVGGVCIRDEAVCAAMTLRSFHIDENGEKFDGDKINTKPCAHKCSLKAKKAWFVFDNEAVALGCGISANDGFEVETAIDNRRLYDRQAYSGDGWVNYGNMLGYVFPNGGKIRTRVRKAEEDFFELWLSHGKNPSTADYAYIILPNQTACRTREYLKNPDAEILSNNTSVQCVYHKGLKIKAFVFYRACEFDAVSVSEPMLLMLREHNGIITAAAADPTRKLKNAEIKFGNKIKSVRGNKRVHVKSNSAVLDFADKLGQSIVFTIKIHGNGVV